MAIRATGAPAKGIRTTPPGGSRRLSEGERALAAAVFGPAVDPDPVRLNRSAWWPLQPASVTMAPDGHLWFHPAGRNWSEDFAVEGPEARGHFIHEMVHVWQHQQGIDLRLARPPLARYRYLPLKAGRLFDAYGLEQQAEIVREAYLLSLGQHLPGRPPLEDYLALIPFWPLAPDGRGPRRPDYSQPSLV